MTNQIQITEAYKAGQKAALSGFSGGSANNQYHGKWKELHDAWQAGWESKGKKMDARYYMNTETGSVGTYDEWEYTGEQGEIINAVDVGEVVEVKKDDNGDWIEV